MKFSVESCRISSSLLTLSYSAVIFLSSFALLVPFHGDHTPVSWSSYLVINALVEEERIIQSKRIALFSENLIKE